MYHVVLGGEIQRQHERSTCRDKTRWTWRRPARELRSSPADSTKGSGRGPLLRIPLEQRIVVMRRVSKDKRRSGEQRRAEEPHKGRHNQQAPTALGETSIRKPSVPSQTLPLAGQSNITVTVSPGSYSQRPAGNRAKPSAQSACAGRPSPANRATCERLIAWCSSCTGK
jgi:hypothetical protein